MKNYNRMTLAERKSIERGLKEGTSLKALAKQLGRHTSTISREIFRNAISVRSGSWHAPFNNCANKDVCDQSRLCDDHPDCKKKSCVSCKLCFYVCPEYKRVGCEKLKSVPFVCNACSKLRRCTLEKFIYRATAAQNSYETTCKDTRSGVAITEAERLRIEKIVSPLIKAGQSPYHICLNHKDDLMMDQKTLYKYIDAGLFTANNFDLHCKVKMKPRKKKASLKIERHCREGRRYRDFLDFMEQKQDVKVVQMDTVIGTKGDGEKVLLTMHFPELKFMLAFIRDTNTARSVKVVFDDLQESLGTEDFSLLFGSICLCDNGSEFSHPSALEKDKNGIQRTSIFYCDPGASYQKAELENNHRLIRKISPKGKSMNGLTQEDVNVMMSHVNSYGRKALNGLSPIEAFERVYSPEIVKKLSLKFISHDEILLRPELIKK